MRNKVFGAIGILWGGAIVLKWMVGGVASGNEAYQAGQAAGAVFGGLLFVLGLYYVFKKPGSGNTPGADNEQ